MALQPGAPGVAPTSRPVPACPEAFVTERLAAERLTPAHFQDLLRMHADPVQMATLGGVRGEAHTRTYMVRHLQHWIDSGFGMWMVRDRTTAEMAGRALLRKLVIDGHDEVEVGYSFYPQFWGRGLATEIAVACVRIGLTGLQLPSVVALTTPANIPSQRVMAKAGMIYDRSLVHDGLAHVLYRTATGG